MDYFTVVCLVAWPLNESEAGVDLVLIETSLLFLCRFLLISTQMVSVTQQKQPREVCIKTNSTPASLSFKAQATSTQLQNSPLIVNSHLRVLRWNRCEFSK